MKESKMTKKKEEERLNAIKALEKVIEPILARHEKEVVGAMLATLLARNLVQYPAHVQPIVYAGLHRLMLNLVMDLTKKENAMPTTGSGMPIETIYEDDFAEKVAQDPELAEKVAETNARIRNALSQCYSIEEVEEALAKLGMERVKDDDRDKALNLLKNKQRRH